jgi:uncharacterized protein (TIGR02266 family)
MRNAILAYTEAHQMENARKHERIDKKTKTIIESDKSVTYSTARNLSDGGIFVTTPEPFHPGTEIDLSLTLPDGSELSLRGIVRWTKDEKDEGDRAGMGIEFQSLSSADQQKIQSILK